MRSFSLVLLRRLLLRPSAPAASSGFTPTLYDQLPNNALSSIERLLLNSVAHEPAAVVRRKAVDTVIDVANKSMQRGRPWHALQVQAFSMAQAPEEGARESAYLIFAGCTELVLDLQTNGVLELLQKGLQDASSVDVRLIFLFVLSEILTSHRSGMLLSEPPSRTSPNATITNVRNLSPSCTLSWKRSHLFLLHNCQNFSNPSSRSPWPDRTSSRPIFGPCFPSSPHSFCRLLT